MSREEIEAAILQSREAFIEAVNRGDAPAASTAYASDAKLVPPSADVVVGRDAIEAFWQAGFDAGLSGVELEPLDLRYDERMGYEVGGYELCLQSPDGDRIIDRGMYLLLHGQQDDGRWLRAVEMFSPTALPATHRARHITVREDDPPPTPRRAGRRK